MLEENQDFTPYAPQFGISRKTKPKNYLDVLRVDGYFSAEPKRKVRIFYVLHGSELPAKSGNANGRKSSRKGSSHST
ncbi:hypothetical protein [uncultured Agathobaculum sp.]|uniref:hypothetical protein n=1 Tax=uncultured Agathobaculum sp. TaxID=2048140 RepID=UPI003207D4A0